MIQSTFPNWQCRLDHISDNPRGPEADGLGKQLLPLVGFSNEVLKSYCNNCSDCLEFIFLVNEPGVTTPPNIFSVKFDCGSEDLDILFDDYDRRQRSEEMKQAWKFN